MILKAVLVTLALYLVSFSTAGEDAVLKYNLGTSGSSVPYENAVDAARKGILVEILPLIMERAGIKTE